MSLLISCIMPTADRHRFVSHAVNQFLSQMYPDKELIVLDSGQRSCERLIREHPDVRYYRTTKKDLGELRNEAIGHARGKIISHWDDDDLHSLDQLTYMLNFMQYNNAKVIGIDRPLFLELRTGYGWQHMKDEFGWVHGSALMYRREVAEHQPFYGHGIEDRYFVRDLVQSGIIPKPVGRHDVHVNLIHEHNVSPKITSRQGWFRTDKLPVWIDRAEYHEVLKNEFA